MLQNTTSLKKSSSRPYNVSDEHVSCIALATRYASVQILFGCPTLAIVFLMWDEVHDPLCLPHKTTSEGQKVFRTRHVFTFDFVACFAPVQCALFQHLDSQGGSGAEVFCTFCFGHMLCATMARTFSTSQVLKVFGASCTLKVLTWTPASRHNDVPLFISSSLIWPDGSAPAALASLLFLRLELQIMVKTPGSSYFL